MKKYQVTIHKNGSENSFITTMIGNQNSEKGRFNLIDVISYLNCMKAAFPIANSGYTYLWDSFNPNGTTLHISEDGGKTFTLSLTQIEVMELKSNVVE